MVENAQNPHNIAIYRIKVLTQKTINDMI